ncbi:hypothetical protein EJ08DRAFT_660259 [Tothia fuscella]|uniref:Uncharacterized protein n=1 Tax=Tothia fuscella TaxID=1048955 RepID=A0A9P4TZP0_9PEZI|nr:hypothetical protein EJ08DRAFT_660259 [Tothia fuscella]
MAATATSSQPAFFKQLAANEKHNRDAALSSLKTYLTNRTTISLLELQKLWKGLFYCMWMSDKPRNQQQLARDLSSLLDILPPTQTQPFLRAFWQTMANEWNGIDVLRMDKFLYLTRQMLNKGFVVCRKGGWESVDGLVEVLGDIPLNVREMKIPNGLRYHVIDIYVDEMEKVYEDGEGEDMPVEVLLAPLRTLGKESLTKSIRERCRAALKDERVKQWLGEEGESAGKGEEVERDGVDDEWGGIED